MFVDCETTGLPACMHAGVRMARNWPDVIQLAYCEGVSGEIVCEYLAPQQPLTEESVKVHKITPEFLEEHASDSKVVFERFLAACARSNRLVAHNIKFDRNVIIANMIRLQMDTSPLLALREYCTMRNACNHVRSRPRKVSGKVVFKMPKLEECAKHFKIKIEGSLHDARTDVDLLRNLYKCLN